jgi:hypothetical protein
VRGIPVVLEETLATFEGWGIPFILKDSIATFDGWRGFLSYCRIVELLSDGGRNSCHIGGKFRGDLSRIGGKLATF